MPEKITSKKPEAVELSAEAQEIRTKLEEIVNEVFEIQDPEAKDSAARSRMKQANWAKVLITKWIYKMHFTEGAVVARVAVPTYKTMVGEAHEEYRAGMDFYKKVRRACEQLGVPIP